MGWKPDHRRLKPKRVRPANAAEKRHHDRLAAMGCLVCKRPAEIHHIHSDGLQKTLRDHRYVAPLCEDHHRGMLGIHKLGHNKFLATYDIDLWMWAQWEWRDSEILETRAA